MTMNKGFAFVSLIIAAICAIFAFTQFHNEDVKQEKELQKELDRISHTIDDKKTTEERILVGQIDQAKAQVLKPNGFLSPQGNYEDEYYASLRSYDSLSIKYNEVVEESEEMKMELKSKKDSLKIVISLYKALKDTLAVKDRIIAQKDSIISFYKDELQRVRKKNADALKLLDEAIRAEAEADRMWGFWSRQERRLKYAQAKVIYERLFKEFEVTTAEDSFHRTWKKIENL